MRQVLRAVVSAAATLIVIGVALGYGGALVFEFDLLAHFRLHFALLAVPLAALAVASRAWGAAARLGVAGLLALAGLGTLWEEPRREATGPPAATAADGADGAPPDVRELTVLTANLYQVNPTPDLMRAAILAADADILVTHETGKSAQTGVTSLARHYGYRLSLETTGQILRTVLWSKFPLRDGTLYLEDRTEPTGVRAIVQIADDVEIGILGLHLAHTLIGNQHVQLAALDRIAEGLPPRRIVLGDFNTTPWSFGMMRMERLTGTRRIGGYRVTWRGHYDTALGRIPAPIGQPIDHVLVSPGIGVLGVETVEIPGSDHWGLLARLAVPG